MSELNTLSGQICEHLRGHYREPQLVLGSKLGAEILKTFPAVSLRTMFGGLRSFIVEYLNDYVVQVGTKGSDVEYKVDFSQVSNGSISNGVNEGSVSIVPPINVSRDSPAPPSSEVNLWHALVNPKSRINSIWNAELQKLVFLNADDRHPTGSTPFTTISFQDHVEITQRFLSQKRLEVPIADADPADRYRYVPAVVEYLRMRGVQGEWEKFRIDEILKLVRSRLQALGATEDASSKIVAELQSSKLRVNPEYQRRSGNVLPAEQKVENSEDKLRKFLSRAVTQMSIGELRDLKISGATLEKTLNLL